VRVGHVDEEAGNQIYAENIIANGGRASAASFVISKQSSKSICVIIIIFIIGYYAEAAQRTK